LLDNPCLTLVDSDPYISTITDFSNQRCVREKWESYYNSNGSLVYYFYGQFKRKKSSSFNTTYKCYPDGSNLQSSYSQFGGQYITLDNTNYRRGELAYDSGWYTDEKACLHETEDYSYYKAYPVQIIKYKIEKRIVEYKLFSDF